jgi:hypothetical protein
LLWGEPGAKIEKKAGHQASIILCGWWMRPEELMAAKSQVRSNRKVRARPNPAEAATPHAAFHDAASRTPDTPRP